MESKKRKAAVLQAFIALPQSEQHEVLADVIAHIEATDVATLRTAPVRAMPTGSPNQTQTFVERAEAFVLAHPDGVKTAEVSKAIGQDVSGVDGSLRQAVKRGRIERQGRLWVPAGRTLAAEEPTTKPQGRITIRDLIVRVYSENSNTPLGASALYEALQALQPDINRSSVDGEMNRMRTASLLKQVAVGQNGGGQYVLAPGKEAGSK